MTIPDNTAPPVADPNDDGSTETTEAAPAVSSLSAADISAIAAQLAPLLSAPAPAAQAAPAAPANPPSPVNLFEQGQVVSFSWLDDYDGPQSRQGLVLDVLPDEGAGASSIIGWFAGVSGPIGDHLLTAD